jgi:hypothetical protein
MLLSSGAIAGGRSGGTALAWMNTLNQLQNGRTSTVIVPRGFDIDLKQRVKCGLTSVSPDPICSACGSERRAARLSDVLSELLQLHKTKIEILNGAAAEQLLKVGGMGGWLRQPSGGVF